MVSVTLRGVVALAIVLASIILPAAGIPDLRIMPLGDSITKGNGSGDRNGYRNRLRQKLLNQGVDKDISVDMIGSQAHGSMTDNNHEGHSGKMLADINTYWKKSIKARPNVVLVHAGTNNMDLEVDLDTAPDLMEAIIDGLLENAPDSVVLIAPVIWANDARMQQNTDRFNGQLEALIKAKQLAGKHVLSIPIDITLADLNDKKHPNDRGYEKMANAWLKGILEADERSWLKTPTKVNAADLSNMGLGTNRVRGCGTPLQGPHLGEPGHCVQRLSHLGRSWYYPWSC